MKHIFKPFLWLGEGIIITLVLLPISLMVYTSITFAFLAIDIYKLIKRL
jgi:hypothetical protein